MSVTQLKSLSESNTELCFYGDLISDEIKVNRFELTFKTFLVSHSLSSRRVFFWSSYKCPYVCIDGGFSHFECCRLLVSR